MTDKSFVYIAGAGPGNKEYITLKTFELIKTCDCIIYDALIDDSVLDNAKEGCKKIYAGKRSGSHYMKQEEINSLIISEAQKNQTVLRLKGGDPFVFGRGSEEALSLIDKSIPFEIIPGVTSAVSVPMSAGIPVTHRALSRSFTVVTGHTADENIENSINFKALSSLDGTIIFLMGLSNIETICQNLIENGIDKNTPASVISNGTKKEQYVLRGTVSDISEKVKSDKKAVSPAVIVIGKTADMDLISKSHRPLWDISVTLCGTSDFCNKLSKKLEVYGAETNILDYVKILPMDKAPLKNELKSISDYTMLVFTGPNSIKLFFDTVKETKTDLRKLSHMKFAVIGKGTRDYLEKFGIYADIMPEDFTSDALAEEIIKNADKSENILIPRALKGNSVLSDILKANNISFKEIPVYDTVIAETESITNDDFIVFSSSAGVKGYFDNKGKISEETKIVCIGKYTADTLKSYGYTEFLLSREASADGITDTILTEVSKWKDSED